LIANELAVNAHVYEGFSEEWDLPGNSIIHFQNYYQWVARMRISGSWGGYATLRAAAVVFGRTFNLVSEQLTLTFTPPGTTFNPVEGDDITLAYMNGNHYRATEPLGSLAATVVVVEEEEEEMEMEMEEVNSLWKKWTKEEEETLTSLVQQYGRSWAEICEENKTLKETSVDRPSLMKLKWNRMLAEYARERSAGTRTIAPAATYEVILEQQGGPSIAQQLVVLQGRLSAAHDSVDAPVIRSVGVDVLVSGGTVDLDEGNESEFTVVLLRVAQYGLDDAVSAVHMARVRTMFESGSQIGIWRRTNAVDSPVFIVDVTSVDLETVVANAGRVDAAVRFMLGRVETNTHAPATARALTSGEFNNAKRRLRPSDQ